MRILTSPILRIAPEGWALLLPLLALALFAVVGECWLLATGVIPLAAAVASFFHDSPRNTAAKPSGILSPCDGRVIFRRECHDPHLRREAIRIGIAVPFFSNYLLRAPVEGELKELDNAPQQISCLQTDAGESIVIAVSRGSLLGAKPVWVAVGDRLGQGRICGKRRLARVIDVYLPSDCRVEIELGQTVRSGETVLATLLRRNA